MNLLYSLPFAPGRDGGPSWITGPLNAALWQFLYWIGQGCWFADRSLLQFAVQLHDLRKAVSDPGGITQVALETIFRGTGSPITGQLIAGMLQAALALFLIGLALRAHNWDFEWVSAKKIILFFFITVALFQTGSFIFTQAEDARTWLQEGAHTIGAAIGQNVSFDQTNHEVPTGPQGPLPTPIFPQTTALFVNDPNYSGVTLAAYILGGATQAEVNDEPQIVMPDGLLRKYFMTNGAQPWPDGCDSPCEQGAMNLATQGIQVLSGGLFVCIYAVLEAALYLVLAFSVLLVFLGTPFALAFSFFNGTEILANSLVRAYIGLLQKTWTYSLALGILNGALVYWARSAASADGAFTGIAATIDIVTLMFLVYAVATMRHALHVQTNTADHSSSPAATMIIAGLTAAALRAIPSFPDTYNPGARPGPDHAAPGAWSAGPRPAQTPAGAGGGETSRPAPGRPGPHAPTTRLVAPSNRAHRSNAPTTPLSAQQQRDPGRQGGGAAEPGAVTVPAAPAPAPHEAPAAGAPGTTGDAAPAGPGPARAGGQEGAGAVDGESAGTAPGPEQGRGAAGGQGKEHGTGPGPASAGKEEAGASGGASAGTGPGPAHGEEAAGGQGTGPGGGTLAAHPPAGNGNGNAGAGSPRRAAGQGSYRPASAMTGAGGQGSRPPQRDGGAPGHRELPGQPGRQAEMPPPQPLPSSQAAQAYDQAAINGAIGRAVESGGTAWNAGEQLGLDGDGWGGHHGAVSSVIQQAPGWGLTTANDVQQFLGIAQRADPVSVAAGRVEGLNPTQASLLTRVNTAAPALPASSASGSRGGRGEQNTQARYLSFLRDVRALPAEVQGTGTRPPGDHATIGADSGTPGPPAAG